MTQSPFEDCPNVSRENANKTRKAMNKIIIEPEMGKIYFQGTFLQILFRSIVFQILKPFFQKFLTVSLSKIPKNTRSC